MPTNETGVTNSASSGNLTQSNIVKNLVKELSENLNLNGEEFVKEEFDVKTFTSAIVKTNVLSEQLAKLSQNVNMLDKEIKEQVSMHHEDLLHQAINIETLEEMLDMVQTRIVSLKNTSERLRLKIASPYNELNLRILQLGRLQEACDTLRRIKGILHHSAKLRIHMQNGVRDIVKSAQCLNELEFLLRDFDANGIDIIEKDVHFAHKSRHEVEEQAQVILDKSLAHLDQTQIGTALQVFYSLGVLTEKLNQALKTNEKTFQKTSNDLLDTTNLTLQSTNSNSNSSSSLVGSTQSSATLTSGVNTAGFPGRATMPNVGSMSQFRAQLWTNVEKLMDCMYDACAQTFQLQQIIEKKKDLLTNLYYMDEIDFSFFFKAGSKMYLSDLVQSKQTDSLDSAPIFSNDSKQFFINSNSESSFFLKIITYESICAQVNLNEININKRTVEFLYEQWRCLTNVLNATMLSACNQSNYVKQTFQNEYPKLLKLQNDLWLRLLQLNPLIDRYRYLNQNSQQKGNVSLSHQSSYDLLRKCFLDLENSYLNRSLSHLFDPINLIFSQSMDKQINKNDTETYIKGVQGQLQTLKYDIFNSNTAPNVLSQQITMLNSYSSVFSEKIVANICKSIQMYANKSEQVLNSLNIELRNSGDAAIGSGGNINSGGINAFSSGLPSQMQIKNLDYVNVTHELYEQMNQMFENEKLDKKLNEKLQSTLNSFKVFEENALNPFIQSASECILAIMLTMHQEDFQQQQQFSLYVRELQQVLQRICRDFLQQFNCKSILNPYLNQLASRCIELFLRHASMLRPMSDSTRKRLVNDSQQIESIIQTILCAKLTDLGVAFKQLKAFRHLLLTSSPLDVHVDNETHYSQVLSESLPHNILLHYLFSFASTDLKSPHQSLDWSLARYSDWLDKHTSEKERLMVIKTCLETYVNIVRQKNEKQFTTVYPIMFRLLEKGLQSVKN